MAKAATTRTTTGDPFLDEPEVVVAQALQSFTVAKRAAIEENDRLGIPSYGAKAGKIVAHTPPAKKPKISVG